MLLGRLEVERLDDICLLGQNGMLELPFAASSIGLVDFLTLGFQLFFVFVVDKFLDFVRIQGENHCFDRYREVPVKLFEGFISPNRFSLCELKLQYCNEYLKIFFLTV